MDLLFQQDMNGDYLQLTFHLQAYEKREETRLGDDHPEALVITVQTNECLG